MLMDAKFAEVPDRVWNQIAPLIPARKSREGRPPVADRIVMAGILYRLRTGCQWKALPSQFGSGSTCHRRMQIVELKAIEQIAPIHLAQAMSYLKATSLPLALLVAHHSVGPRQLQRPGSLAWRSTRHSFLTLIPPTLAILASWRLTLLRLCSVLAASFGTGS